MAVTKCQQTANPDSTYERHNNLHRLRIAAYFPKFGQTSLGSDIAFFTADDITNERYRDWLGDNGRLVCEDHQVHMDTQDLCKAHIKLNNLVLIPDLWLVACSHA